jgi:hypothetical protein
MERRNIGKNGKNNLSNCTTLLLSVAMPVITAFLQAGKVEERGSGRFF